MQSCPPLLHCVNRLVEQGRVKLLHLTIRGGHLLHITKLHTVFEIFESEDEAIRSFGLESA